MAARDINAAGGIKGRKIKLKIFDDVSDPARSAIAMRRLVGANVDVIVGGWGSSQVLVNLEIAEQAGMPYIIVGATNPRITSEKNRWTFRVIQNDRALTRRLAQVSTGQFALKRIAVISDKNAYGSGSRDTFISALSDLGFNPVDVQSYNSSDIDFQKQLNSIKAAAPDGIALFGTLPAAPTIMKQARRLGIDARFLGTGGVANTEVTELSLGAAENMVLVGLFDEQTSPEAKAWSLRYRQEFNIEGGTGDPSLAALEYQAIRRVAAPCLGDAAGDRTALRDCIGRWRGNLFGLGGEVHFDKSGQLVQSSPVFEIRDGVWHRADIAKRPSP